MSQHTLGITQVQQGLQICFCIQFKCIPHSKTTAKQVNVSHISLYILILKQKQNYSHFFASIHICESKPYFTLSHQDFTVPLFWTITCYMPNTCISFTVTQHISMCHDVSLSLTLICLIHPMTVVSSTCSTAARLVGLAAASASTSIDGRFRTIRP